MITFNMHHRLEPRAQDREECGGEAIVFYRFAHGGRIARDVGTLSLSIEGLAERPTHNRTIFPHL
jgi:hypothetical protein